MEKQSLSDAAADSEEIISDSFFCCVCLELLYKPIVLSCGHVSCFWCVHKSMNGMRESHCPICRHSYNHFPTVCEMLHFLLMKMYPVAYKMRDNQVIEEEKKSGYFSPQFDAHACGSHANEELYRLGGGDSAYPSATVSNSGSDDLSTQKGELCVNMDQLGSSSLIQDYGTTIPEQNSNRSSEVIKTVSVQEDKMALDKRSGTCYQVTVADVLCSTCKKLLCHPVVFNCGHVHCESCIINPVDAILRCQVCESLHPKGFPKVCLELDHFLEQHFPEEYAQRRVTVELEQVHFKHENPTTCSKEDGKKGLLHSTEPTGEHLSIWSDPNTNVHIGVGCDSCGVYPIVGDRYKCKDCEEAIGFDLCGECYNTRSKLPGRFNQQHTPEHKFERINSNMIRNFMVRWVGSHIGDGSQNASDRSEWLRAINRVWSETSESSENGAIYNTLVSLLSDSMENSENISPAPTVPGDVLIGLLSDSLENGSADPILPSGLEENAESGLAPHVPYTDTAHDQNDPRPTS